MTLKLLIRCLMPDDGFAAVSLFFLIAAALFRVWSVLVTENNGRPSECINGRRNRFVEAAASSEQPKPLFC